MFVNILKISRNKYSFEIGDEKSDSPQSFLSSTRDHCLFPLASRTYHSFGEAYHCAQKIVEKSPTSILAKKLSFYKKAIGIGTNESEIDEGDLPSINDMITEHYVDQLDLIQKRFNDVTRDPENKNFDKEIKAVDEELKILIENIKKVAHEWEFEKNELEAIEALYKNCTDLKKDVEKETNKNIEKTSSHNIKQEEYEEDFTKDTLRAFGESVLLTLKSRYPDCYINDISLNNETQQYFVNVFNNASSKNLLKLAFNENLLLIDVIVDGTKKYEKRYYDEWWLPVVWSVGNYFIPEHNSIIVPKHEDSNKNSFSAFEPESGKLKKISIVFNNENNRIKKSWWIKTSQASIKKIMDYDNQTLLGMEVKCIDRGLPKYYNRTGQITKVIPREGYIDVEIDFRRGLDKLVLKDSQIEIINLPT